MCSFLKRLKTCSVSAHDVHPLCLRSNRWVTEPLAKSAGPPKAPSTDSGVSQTQHTHTLASKTWAERLHRNPSGDTDKSIQLNNTLPSVFRCVSPESPASSSSHPAGAWWLPGKGIHMKKWWGTTLCYWHENWSSFSFTPSLTCFFFRASSEVFWAALMAAGLYTVLVSPMDVENT